MFLDFANKEIKIGDEIIYSSGRKHISRAQVIEFTTKKRTVYNKNWLGEKVSAPVIKIMHLEPNGIPEKKLSTGMLEPCNWNCANHTEGTYRLHHVFVISGSSQGVLTFDK